MLVPVFVNARFCLVASVTSALESLTRRKLPISEDAQKGIGTERKDFELALTRQRVSFTHGLQKEREQTGRVY